MVKKFLKTNNNFVWSLGVIGIVLLFLYVGARREGFQNMPTSGPSVPSISPIPPMPSVPSVPSVASMPPMPTTMPIMPTTMPTTMPIMPTTMPTPLTNPKPSIATVRSKLNELKTMVDNM